MVAFVCRQRFHLCAVPQEDLQPEFQESAPWFISVGTGRAAVDSFLGLIARTLFDGSQPELREGTFAVAWALRHAVACGMPGVREPIQIAVLRRELPELPYSAHRLTDAEISETMADVREAESHLASYRPRLADNGR